MEKYLTIPKGGARIDIIEDIGQVCDDDLPPDNTITLEDAEVIGIQNLQAYTSCLACSAKLGDAELDGNMRKCSKCEMIQPIARCKRKVSARLFIEQRGEYYTLSAFDDILTEIAQSSTVTPQSLMFKKLSLSFENNIITSVRHSS